jgi:hypothetical protein
MKMRAMIRPPPPKAKYTNHDAGRPTPGKVRSIRIGPRNGMAASQAGKVGGRIIGKGRYGDAKTPKAPIVRTIRSPGIVIRRTSMKPMTA